MSERPSVLIPHLLARQFSAERAREVRDALTDRLPDLNVTVAESEAASLDAVDEIHGPGASTRCSRTQTTSSSRVR